MADTIRTEHGPTLPNQPALTEADDGWHDHSPHWWETETAWFTFNVPERKMAGGLYIKAHAVQGTVDGGAWLWDATDADAVYDVQPANLPFPDRGGDLRDLTAPNGVHVKMLEPLMKFHTTYHDPGRFEADLVHEGIHPPHSHPIGAWPYWNSRHLDQTMHTTGTITVAGEVIPVDCYSIRDRSWGPRPEGPTPPDKKLERGAWTFNERPARAALPYSVAYMFAGADDRNAWLVGTSPLVDADGTPSDELDPGAGYLIQDGIYAPLIRGHREVVIDPQHKWTTNVHIEALDTLGRRLVVDGELLSRWGSKPGGCALFRWTWGDGLVGYGEDETGAPLEWMETLNGMTFPPIS